MDLNTPSYIRKPAYGYPAGQTCVSYHPWPGSLPSLLLVAVSAGPDSSLLIRRSIGTS